MLSAVPEPRNIVDKYAVSVQRDDEVVERKIRPFCEDNFLFFACR